MLLRLILIAACALISAAALQDTTSLAKEAKPTANLPQQAVEYLFDLESEDFKTRETATRELPKYGEQVIEPLLKITHGDSLEASVRAILVLEQIYARGNKKSVNKAEDSLDLLTKARNPSIATRANEAIDRNADIWEKRAVSKIRNLGGKVKVWTAGDIAKTQRFRNITPGQVRYVVLGSRWSGAEQGLRFIKRISNLEILYVINGHTLSDLALENLMKALPATRFQTRDSDAMLGISGGNDAIPGGCLVGEVSDGLAAQKAGIQSNDFIISFDGKKVENFESLVELIGKKEAGDTTTIQLIRDQKLIKLNVTLSSWLDK